MGLFRSRQALTGQKQAKKILKIPGQRIDAVPQRIGRINSKYRLTEAFHKTIVDSVHSLPADHLRPLGRTEVIAASIPRRKAKLGNVDLQFFEFLIQSHIQVPPATGDHFIPGQSQRRPTPRR
jgi:hypothetical protein